MLLAIATTTVTFAVSPAFAYVGPGAGLTLLGALWGLVLAVVMSVGFVILWPFRRLMRRRKRVCSPPDGGQSADELSVSDDHSMLNDEPDKREQR
jgi:membrane protein implicated in regulation of membrane protease activity